MRHKAGRRAQIQIGWEFQVLCWLSLQCSGAGLCCWSVHCFCVLQSPPSICLHRPSSSLCRSLQLLRQVFNRRRHWSALIRRQSACNCHSEPSAAVRKEEAVCHSSPLISLYHSAASAYPDSSTAPFFFLLTSALEGPLASWCAFLGRAKCGYRPTDGTGQPLLVHHQTSCSLPRHHLRTSLTYKPCGCARIFFTRRRICVCAQPARLKVSADQDKSDLVRMRR